MEVSRSRLSDIHPCPTVLVNGISGAMEITSQGRSGNLSNVLFAPKASSSVRSVGCLVDSHGGAVIHTRSSAYLDPNFTVSESATEIARRSEDGLYEFIHGSVPPLAAGAFLSVAQQVKRECVHRLHRAFGHAPPARLKLILERHPEVASTLRPSDVQLFTTCDACQTANSGPAAPKSSASSRATSVGYRLHMDTTGVIRPSTSSGFRRALVAVDDASRYWFVSIIRNVTMEIMAPAIRSILHSASNGESVLRTKIVRSDNGKEFKNTLVNAFLAEADITREFTCTDTSHQNGVAERAIGAAFAGLRTLLVDSALPPSFWGEALMHYVHTRNRMPCSVNPSSISPFQARFGHPPRPSPSTSLRCHCVRPYHIASNQSHVALGQRCVHRLWTRCVWPERMARVSS